ncbi:MAG: colicin E5-related ribonuclease [Candidatus Competibacteraceae bacterium]
MIEPKPWKLGGFKPHEKWQSQMAKRGWTEQQINEAIAAGAKKPAQNFINKDNSATRYVHPETGRSVVIDDVTGEVIHVGGDGFKY